MQNDRVVQKIDLFVLLGMMIVFLIGYKFFYHHKKDILPDRSAKAGLYLLWLSVIFLIGLLRLRSTARNIWLIFYITIIMLLTITAILQLQRIEFLSETISEIRLFFSSPLPYGCLLVLQRIYFNVNGPSS